MAQFSVNNAAPTERGEPPLDPQPTRTTTIASVAIPSPERTGLAYDAQLALAPR